MWHPLLQPRVVFFAWRLMHRKTPTLSWVQSIGISLAPMCCLCNSSSKSDTHLFLYCSFASLIWSWVLNAAGVRSPYQFSPSQIWDALASNSDKLPCKGASSIFSSTAFVIWKCRNHYIFRDIRASQTKAKRYLFELLPFSLRQINKHFSGRPLQTFCNSMGISSTNG